jgi:hypothetical protein
MCLILKKTPWPGEVHTEAAERPHPAWETSKIKFDTLPDPHEMTMSQEFLSGSLLSDAAVRSQMG